MSIIDIDVEPWPVATTLASETLQAAPAVKASPASHRAGAASARTATVAGLVASASTGDQDAWTELVGRFEGMIASVGRRAGLNAADVYELQQTTWLRLVEHLGDIEHPERVGGWLQTTARRQSLQILARATRCAPDSDDLLSKIPDDRSPEVDAATLATERDALVQRALRRLKPRCRDLLSLLVVDDGLGYRELSTLLRMPVGSIGPTRGRCIEHLRRLVIEEGLTEF